VNLIARVVMGTTVVVLTGLAIWAPQVMSLFTDDPETLPIGVNILRVLSLGYLAFSLTNVYDFAQAGAGDTVSPMAINLFALWLVQIPLAFALSRPLGLGADGVWLGMMVGWVAQAALMFWRYRQGRWKLVQI
jgi:Na+-driven multidrug efflux pump